MRFVADWRNTRANAAKDRGEIEKAISLYRKAIKADPTWSVPWYNLGLIAKYQHDWKTSLAHNKEAVQRNDADTDAWWNLGIAATALGEWEQARNAWSKCGIDLPNGTAEVRENFGTTPIRINPDDDGEVIWTRRIDPARAIITSVPLPGSDHRHGDLLLHDGAANGYRMYHGREVPVFDELMILSPSKLGTYETTVSVDSVDQLAVLELVFGEAGAAAEDWSSVRYICRQCSEGRPHQKHDRGEAHAAGERRIGIAADSTDSARELLFQWQSRTSGQWSTEIEMHLAPSSEQPNSD